MVTVTVSSDEDKMTVGELLTAALKKCDDESKKSRWDDSQAASADEAKALADEEARCKQEVADTLVEAEKRKQ